jgi:hypothetical protein
VPLSLSTQKSLRLKIIIKLAHFKKLLDREHRSDSLSLYGTLIPYNGIRLACESRRMKQVGRG